MPNRPQRKPARAIFTTKIAMVPIIEIQIHGKAVLAKSKKLLFRSMDMNPFVIFGVMADLQNSSAFEKRVKKHVIGKPHRFLAVAPLGFEETLVDELKFLQIASSATSNSTPASPTTKQGTAPTTVTEEPHIVSDGKVNFTAKITEAWKAVAYSRIANRILMEIGNFKAENFGQLEKGAAAIPWELYLDERQNTARGPIEDFPCIHVTCKHSRLYHSDAVEERVRKIIEKALDTNAVSSSSAAKTSVAKGCSQNLYVNLLDDRCTIWLDLAGKELYKRGHERFVAEAPLKETIAAAMIFEACRLQVPGSRLQASGDNTASATPQSERCERPHTSKRSDLITFIDPMAGSGTFSLEAAYIANGLIPGKCRDFALKHQPAFKEGTWNFILKGVSPQSESNERLSNNQLSTSYSLLPTIITSDISERPINIIKHNIENSPLKDICASAGENAIAKINPQLKDFFSYTAQDILKAAPEANSAIILLNPPYGKRLDCDAPSLYSRIGKKLSDLAQELRTIASKGPQAAGPISLIVAILAPKDDTRNGARYTCTTNLLKTCPALNPSNNPEAKLIETSHGGFSLNAIFARI